MKGGIACSVAAMLAYLADNGGRPKGSISFLITGDEEDISVNGTVKLLNGAPSAARNSTIACSASRRMSRFSATASRSAAAVRSPARSMSTACRATSPIRIAPPIRCRIPRLIVALSDEPLDHGSAQFQASNLEFTSVDVGNTASNVIPGQARAKFNIRFNDNHTQETLRALVEERLAKPAETASAPVSCGIFQLQRVRDKARRVHRPRRQRDRGGHGPPARLSTSGGTSDARFISSYCPVIEFGLVGQTMHQVDERTPLSDLEKLTKIYRGVLDRYFA